MDAHFHTNLNKQATKTKKNKTIALAQEQEVMDKVVDILMVEDSESDAALAFEALNRGKFKDNVHHAKDGEEALRYLFQRGEYASAALPSLVLLDLNMPGTDGREVLKQIRSSSNISKLPVIVMTSSKYDADMLTSQGLEASGYIVKPVGLDKIAEIVDEINQS